MKKNNMLAIFLVILTLVSCKDEIADNIVLLKEDYNNTSSLENAIILGEYYNTHYHRDIDEAEEGIAWLEGVLEKYPDSRKLQILLGNLYTLAGSCYFDKDDYSSALKYVDIGIQMMDKTLNKYPDDPYVLIYHGINNSTLPDMFNRKENAIKDLTKMIDLGEEITGKDDRIKSFTYLINLYDSMEYADKVEELEDQLNSEYPDLERGNG